MSYDTSYFSFLLCQHQDRTDLYINGRPIGVFKEGKFVRHELCERPIMIRDLVPPVPFHTSEELRILLIDAINSIHIPHEEKSDSKV